MPTATQSRTTAEIAQNGSWTPQAEALVKETASPERFVQSLVEKKLYGDALQFLTRWLPRRDAAWWTCLCLWHTERPNFNPDALPTFQAAVHWVQNPEQEKEHIAQAAAEADRLEHPAARLATAVACGDPMRGANLLLATLLLAAARSNPLDPAVSERDFVELGLEIAGGKNRWA